MSLIQENVPLREYSSFKIGGNAKYFLEVSSKEELVEGLKEWRELSSSFPESDRRIFIIGGGTNLLVSDNGFSGLAIHVNIKFIKIAGEVAKTGAGNLIPQLLDTCIKNSLSGLEWAGGLPGTVGGAVRGNAGAFGGETKDNVLEVESLDINTLGQKTRKNAQCKFAYRDSVYKSGEGKDEIIISASFGLKYGDMEEIRSATQEKINYREAKHPLHLPNAGSIFKNVNVEDAPGSVISEFESSIKNDPFPVIPTAKLLIRAGLQGKKVGGAQVSQQHPNFIVNIGNARSSDVKDLIELEKEAVKQRLGVDLEVEVMFVE
ncbi:MAG: UDP-N-acetylmuramate dehydrogenase [Candidatus Levybacteria bacterium]|nr:UDP-N-acetylmuramate dehydrogenase [Candidatus Levybacteria bacterium]